MTRNVVEGLHLSSLALADGDAWLSQACLCTWGRCGALLVAVSREETKGTDVALVAALSKATIDCIS